MSKPPLISVCIPSYNGEAFIVKTLQSVVSQTIEDFEVVVCDDGSTDETCELVRGFKDPRVRLVQNDSNQGLGQNWNRALSLVLGKYVKLLCSDDLLHPECLERQFAVLERFPSVVLTLCRRQVINQRDRVIWKTPFPLPTGRRSGKELVRMCVRSGTNILGEPAVGLFRREVMTQHEMCDPSNPFLADLSLWCSILRNGDCFLDPEYLAYFRVSPGAASARIGLKQASAFRAFARKLYQDHSWNLQLKDLASGSALSLFLCAARNIYTRVQSSSLRNNSLHSATVIQGRQQNARFAASRQVS